MQSRTRPFRRLLFVPLLAAASAAQGPILINEIHGFPGALSPSEDYIELWNQSAAPINLNGWTLGAWSGDAGLLSTLTFASPTPIWIYGGCFYIVQAEGTYGDPPLGACLGLRGLRTGTAPSGAGQGFYMSTASAGAFLTSPAGVCSDYVYLRRGATPPPAAAPHLALAGTGAAFTTGNVAASGSGNGHLKRIGNGDGNSVADWTQSASVNVGTPGALNTTLGAAQVSLGVCIAPQNGDDCAFGQQNGVASLVVCGLVEGTAPYMGDVYPDNEPITFDVFAPTLPGAPWFMAASVNCNVGHFVDPAGQSFDLGHSALGFCDVELLSPPFAWSLCSGVTPIFGFLDGAGLTGVRVDVPGIVFPRYVVQAGVFDPSMASGLRMTAATSFEAKPGSRLLGATALPLAIPDGSASPGPGATVVSDLVVTSGGVVTDLNVVLQLSHAWMGDLQVRLTHVDTGTTALLMTAGTPDDGSRTNGPYEFSDEATTSFDAAALATPPAVVIPPGLYRPDALLSIFDGESMTGTWRLSVFDNFASATGVVERWHLLANTPR